MNVCARWLSGSQPNLRSVFVRRKKEKKKEWEAKKKQGFLMDIIVVEWSHDGWSEKVFLGVFFMFG